MPIVTQVDFGTIDMGIPCFPGDHLKYFKMLKSKAVIHKQNDQRHLLLYQIQLFSIKGCCNL